MKKGRYKVGYIVVVTIITLILILGIPYIINELYMKNEGYTTLWEAKDVLSFYGSVLSFIGTCVLGALSLYQNKLYKEENEKAQKMQENYYRNERRPIYQFKYSFSVLEKSISLYPKKMFETIGYNERIIECKILDGDLSTELTVVDWNNSSEFKFNIPGEIEYDKKDMHYMRLILSYIDIFNCTVHDTYWLMINDKGECSTYLEKRDVK